MTARLQIVEKKMLQQIRLQHIEIVSTGASNSKRKEKKRTLALGGLYSTIHSEGPSKTLTC